MAWSGLVDLGIAGSKAVLLDAPGSSGSADGSVVLFRCSCSLLLRTFSELAEDLASMLSLPPLAGEGSEQGKQVAQGEQGTEPDAATSSALPLVLCGCAVPALPLLALGPAAGPPMVLALSSAVGVMSGQKVALLAASCMLMGSWVTWQRQHDRTHERRAVCRLTSGALLLSCGAHAAFWLLPGAGALLAPLAASPWVALRQLQELAVVPLWVAGLGHARNLGRRELLQTVCFAVLGAGGQLGAAMAGAPELQWCLLGFSCTCAGVVAFQVSSLEEPPDVEILVQPHWTQGMCAPRAPLASRGQLQRSGNLLALYWLAGCLIQCLGLAHQVDEPQQMLEFGLLDAILKLGGCHLLTKQPRLTPRSEPEGLSPRSSSEGGWGTPRSALGRC